MRLVAEKRLKEPVEKTFVNVLPKKQVLGKTFKQAAKPVTEALQRMEETEIAAMEAALYGEPK